MDDTKRPPPWPPANGALLPNKPIWPIYYRWNVHNSDAQKSYVNPLDKNERTKKRLSKCMSVSDNSFWRAHTDTHGNLWYNLDHLSCSTPPSPYAAAVALLYAATSAFSAHTNAHTTSISTILTHLFSERVGVQEMKNRVECVWMHVGKSYLIDEHDSVLLFSLSKNTYICIMYIKYEYRALAGPEYGDGCWRCYALSE